ncbi:MAG: hypothetical protein J07HQW1_01978 [Haloquadratum walsbyi J07HQW1]|jgi:hypothetical protein|uniref:Uncharacterized protein n=1 Tax=Haloquadratum walsbyi J07HQW1 TaxID=1238424 RepID=U1MPR2_9EURY|nr:MAG: hypothetical protein J07HQW1_01978 [Haloquadratum walsbyi J07HQW1]
MIFRQSDDGMRLPSHSHRDYVESVATILITTAIFQYVGVFGPSGEINRIYLASLGLSVILFVYLLTVVCDNISWVPQWDRMVQTEE